jgi:competence protein ComEA
MKQFLKKETSLKKIMQMVVAVSVVVSLFAAGAVFAQTMNGLVNINTADEAALVALDHIGKAKAQAIVKYRQERGMFKSIDELKAVPGIGDRVFAAIRDKITVEDTHK